MTGGHTYYEPYRRTARASHKDVVAPVIRRLQDYDTLRSKLETEGGSTAEARRLTELLASPIVVKGYYETLEVQLTKPVSLQIVSQLVWDVRVQVRRLPTGFPVYYLARIDRDYWGEYSFVIEDVYRSPGYPELDGRFVPLMQRGRETYFLRLSPFRRALEELVRDEENPERAARNVLYDAGRSVLGAAWHEDQLLAMILARHYGQAYDRFRRAVELTYLVLSGELTELRQIASPRLRRFFEVVYPHPEIADLLTRLPTLSGRKIDELPRRALPLYGKLSRAFGEFLRTEVPWNTHTNARLYKLILGNFPRIERLEAVLDPHNSAAATDIARLGEVADQVVSDILGGASPPLAIDGRYRSGLPTDEIEKRTP